MKAGTAFELLVKNILLHIGFSQVSSDGLYIFDSAPGQMIQGLGDAHNADVLLEPPVQTPFYTPTRLLIECKDYSRPVGLNTLRSALGLREDINHFDIVNKDELESRRVNRRRGLIHNHTRYAYQVAVASMSGFTTPAQNFAASHRIPLIEFHKMPFWNDFCDAVYSQDRHASFYKVEDEEIESIIHRIASRCAIAITNLGQMIFLYQQFGEHVIFSDRYFLRWTSVKDPWTLVTDGAEYQFQLPEYILKKWIDSSVTELDKRINAINYKANFMSHLVVYYCECSMPQMKMISINRNELEEARNNLIGNNFNPLK